MTSAPLSRRRFLTTVGAAAAAAGVAPGTASAAPSGPRPNILWLVSEDNNPYVGAYGDPLARTPTIDALAREGVRYRNAFSTSPVCAPSRFSIITGVCPESAGPARHMRAQAELPTHIRGFPEYLRQAGYFCTNNNKTDYNAGIDLAATWDLSGPFAHWRRRPTGTPFFAVFNYMATHESQLFHALDGPTDPARVRVPPYLPDTPRIRKDRAHQYDLIARMDSQLAARLAELDANGLAEDTIVFYYGDNGGALPWSKRHATDDGLRVPLIVRFPPRWAHLAPAPPGSVIDQPVTLMDLGPTVLSLAGVPIPDHVDGQPLAQPRQYAFGGRDRMDERYDLVRTATDGRLRYIRNYQPHRPYGQVNAYAWQQKGYQDWEQAHLDGTLDDIQERFWHERPAEELYDTRTDPDHLHNLIADPRYSSHLTELRDALDAHMISVNDNGFIPEGSPLEGYDNSRQPGAYPLRKVMALAAKAIQRDPAHADEFVQLLSNSNEVMRYWAAHGLLMLEPEAVTRTDVEQHWNTEQSPQVKIALSELLVKLGHQDAVTWLSNTLRTHPNVRVRLQAINALTHVGDAAKPALPALSFAVLHTDEYVRRSAYYLTLVLTGLYTPRTPLTI